MSALGHSATSMRRSRRSALCRIATFRAEVSDFRYVPETDMTALQHAGFGVSLKSSTVCAVSRREIAGTRRLGPATNSSREIVTLGNASG
jgi:hypothetical protein